MKTPRFNLLASLAVATAVSFGLAGCGSSSNAPEPPPPEPTPMPPTDLETTQGAAAAVAAVAQAASDAADASASGAETATMNVASLQTGEMAKAHAMNARKYADMAMAAATAARAASAAAAGASTASAAGRELEKAEAARDMAQEHAAMADEQADMAMEAATTEIQVDGAMYSVGNSSVDTRMGMLTSQDKMAVVTGHISDVSRSVAEIEGQAFADGTAEDATITTATPTDPSDDVAYKQAVAAGMETIGKTLDTTDDMARLVLIDNYVGTKSVRVAVEILTTTIADFVIVESDGRETEGADRSAAEAVDATEARPLRSAGMYYLATDRTDAATDTADGVLQATDIVAADAEGTSVFSYVPAAGGDPMYVIVQSTLTEDEVTVTTYRHVDVTAVATPVARGVTATGTASGTEVGVTASLPERVEYDYIQFGVWASLKDNEDGDNSVLGDLGIGFVNSSADVTSVHVTGTATFKGDWVGVVRKMHSKSFKSDNDSATLTANFSEGEFTAELVNLATLEGTIAGNAFSGTMATDIAHDDLDSTGTFMGSFNGGIYGADGSEAAGVFRFDGDDAGAFRGAFGGKDKSNN